MICLTESIVTFASSNLEVAAVTSNLKADSLPYFSVVSTAFPFIKLSPTCLASFS